MWWQKVVVEVSYSKNEIKYIKYTHLLLLLFNVNNRIIDSFKKKSNNIVQRKIYILINEIELVNKYLFSNLENKHTNCTVWHINTGMQI